LRLGFYDNFPKNIHIVERFNSVLSSKQLQRRLIQALYNANRKEFSFEQVANPTIPNGKVIFEVGLAESGNFNFIDDEELKKVLDFLDKERLHSMDFFCVIRYYKFSAGTKTSLKFDYYMLRAVFGKDTLEVRVFHERGPRYISPEDLTTFIFNTINETSSRKALKKANL
jgi:hypothetical protein